MQWIVVLCAAAPLCAASCDSLASLSLPNTRITGAQLVDAGKFAPPGKAPGKAYSAVPSFCRVTATLTPSSDSDIKVEVWLPVSGWNQKFQAVGNGGWAGVISYGALAEAVKAGYAAASTDTGHSTPGGAFALGHPEKLVDFSWRSEHEMTVKGKAIVQAFYGENAHRAYWNGCSTGGRQALKEAQMFPDDFDGIIAGAPGNRNLMALWIAHATLKDPASHIPAEKFPLIHQAALAACDAIDGVKDGLIGDPTRCRFDPGVLLCKGTDSAGCLTAAQVEGVRHIYSSPKAGHGENLFGPLAPGSELGWSVMAGGPEPYGAALDQLRFVVFKDPAWDWRTFDFKKDVKLFAKPEYLIMNATDPDIHKFFSHGGKLLMYQGWNDQNVSPYNTVAYYRSVEHALGPGQISGNLRLFMMPGMAHCSGGEGPNTFDKVGTLDHWVEGGPAPDSIVASHAAAGKVDRTRPLCAYPETAKYKGSGSIDDAANFTCSK